MGIYVYAIELRKIGCLFPFSYVSIAIVYSSLAEVKNEYTTNENGIHISPKIESVLMNIFICNQVYSRLTKNNKRTLHISPRSSLTVGLIFMN